jgi:hypothetical protein
LIDQVGPATDLVPAGPNLNRVQNREMQKICKIIESRARGPCERPGGVTESAGPQGGQMPQMNEVTDLHTPSMNFGQADCFDNLCSACASGLGSLSHLISSRSMLTMTGSYIAFLCPPRQFTTF